MYFVIHINSQACLFALPNPRECALRFLPRPTVQMNILIPSLSVSVFVVSRVSFRAISAYDLRFLIRAGFEVAKGFLREFIISRVHLLSPPF